MVMVNLRPAAVVRIVSKCLYRQAILMAQHIFLNTLCGLGTLLITNTVVSPSSEVSPSEAASQPAGNHVGKSESGNSRRLWAWWCTSVNLGVVVHICHPHLGDRAE